MMKRNPKSIMHKSLASCLVLATAISSVTPAVGITAFAEETQTAESTAAAESAADASGTAETTAQSPAPDASGAAPETTAESAADPSGVTGYASTYDPSLVGVDETLYINLDPYGKITHANVVKGLTSSKNIRYQDYGTYSAVLNMSNEEELTLDDQGVSFNLNGDGKKFFFQGTVDETKLELPWTISVDYKLNGLPVEADALAGVTGTIEVHVKATPNTKAPLYQQNNMLLTVIIPADDSVKTIDAPGSQTQSVGDVSGVAFTALPAEEKEFTARLGAEDYESVGVIVMMIPATLDSFDNVTDIKELKDTWKDSGDAMYDSMNALIDTTTSLRAEMDGLKQSLNSAESARQKISTARPAIFAATDESLQSLINLSTSVQQMIPYLSTAQTELSEINTDMNALVNNLGGMTTSLHTLYQGLNRLEDGSYGLMDSSSDLTSLVDELTDAAEELGIESEATTTLIDSMLKKYTYSQLLQKAGMSADQVTALFTELVNSVDISKGGKVSTEGLEELITALSGSNLENASEIVTGLETFYDSIETQISESGSSLTSSASSLVSDLRHFLSGMGKSAQGAKYAANDLRTLIERTEELNDTLNAFYPDTQNMLTQCQDLLGRTGETLNKSTNALSLTHEALKSASDDIDSSLSASIQTSLNMIDKTLNIFDSLDQVKDAGAVAKGALDDEVDKFEDENKFLEMDPEAEKESFTSSKNKEPNSLQIVLRTDEISKDDDDEGVMDAEIPLSEMGLWDRVKNVFIQLFNAVKSIFGQL